MAEAREILVVEDCEHMLVALSRAFDADCRLSVHADRATALSAIASGCDPWAAVVDVCLPDGSGLDVLEALRTHAPTTPVLVMTGAGDHETIARAQLLGAQFLLKPFEQTHIDAFVAWAEQWHDAPHRQLQRFVAGLSARHGLSMREAEIVRMFATGVPVAELHDRLGVSANTVKTLTRRALCKCQARSLRDLVSPFYQTMRPPTDSSLGGQA